MKKAKSTEMTSIRKKLLAAVAMLLVACVMTVSSTYAWFTLSTAPEVKGITTTVGANGNLEIALGTYDTVWGSPLLDPASSVGDSLEDWTVKNITWGNLVDLSDTSYGLGKIKLYPTRLNATGTTLNANSPLKYAVYGSDGRVANLSENTLLGYYDSNSIGFSGGTGAIDPDSNNGIGYKGVNAIGSASSMSEREFATRNNRAAIKSNKIAARNAAQEAIYNYAGQLAGLAISGGTSIKYAEVAVLNNLVSKLEDSADAMDAALKAALGVIVASKQLDIQDDAIWKLAANAINSAENYSAAVTALENLTNEGTAVNLPIGTLLTQYLPVAEYDIVRNTINDAKNELATIVKPDGVPDSDVIPDSTAVVEAVSILLTKSGILIAGQTIDDLTGVNGTDAKETAMKAAMAQISNLKITFSKDSGVFSDIAEMVGPYNSSLTFPDGISVESIPIGGMTVNVEVSPNNAGDELGLLSTALSAENFNALAGTGSAVKGLTDTYGYSVDLLFRTNASESDLLLQIEGANRVYKDGTNSDLQGEGSNMTFTTSAQYGEKEIKQLAEGIRVVFYNTTSGEIYAVAVLDTEGGKTTGQEYKMNLKLVEWSIATENTATHVVGQMVIGNDKADNKLVALNANQTQRISALVYLDGDVTDNGDVSAVADVNGKLNLQFASSATLTPMVNNDLMGQ